jgi:hypothetical protein
LPPASSGLPSFTLISWAVPPPLESSAQRPICLHMVQCIRGEGGGAPVPDKCIEKQPSPTTSRRDSGVVGIWKFFQMRTCVCREGGAAPLHPRPRLKKAHGAAHPACFLPHEGRGCVPPPARDTSRKYDEGYSTKHLRVSAEGEARGARI